MTTVILTRVVPHYRATLYQRLHESFGWIVAAADDPPAGMGLDLVRDAPWLKRFRFRWPDPAVADRVQVPLADVLSATQARNVISESSLSMSSTWRLPWLRRTRGRPRVLFWSHGWNMERGFASPQDLAAQMARLVPFRFADGHVCYSEEGARYLARFLGRERVFVARNTIDVNGIRERTANVAAATLPGGGPHLLSSGRLTADKRFDRLVRAALKLRERFGGLTLTVVGEGPARNEVERAAGAALGSSVFLPGAIYDEVRLAGYFKAADLFVYAGAVGLAVNHALAYGLPVVAFDRLPEGPRHHPEIAYVVDDVTGWRVRPATDEAFAALIAQKLSAALPPRERLAAALEEYVQRNLLIERMVEDFGIVHGFLEGRR